jgi:hypothetical protein
MLRDRIKIFHSIDYKSTEEMESAINLFVEENSIHEFSITQSDGLIYLVITIKYRVGSVKKQGRTGF